VAEPDSKNQVADFLPIWSCSVWGLPCPRHYWRGGALLPHLFTLTPARKGPGGIFSVALSVERSRPNQRGGPPGRYPAHCSAEFGLSSPRVRRREKRPSGPAAYGIIICDEGCVFGPGSCGSGASRASSLWPRPDPMARSFAGEAHNAHNCLS
jgi:hypothetical protein